MQHNDAFVNRMDNKIRGGVTLRQLALVCYMLFWLLKPFYIFKSGSVQPGDAFLLLAFLALLCSNNGRFTIGTIDKFFFMFFAFVCLVNLVYYIIRIEFSFIKSILYYVFNVLAVCLFRELSQIPKFYSRLAAVLKINIIVQVVIRLTGLGSWFAASRYMGTYNDPNQLAFGVLSAYCMLFCIGRIIPVKRKWLYFAMTAYLIYESSSTGMLVAIAILFVCEQYFRIVSVKGEFNRALYVVYLLIVSFAFALVCIEIIRVLKSGETDNFFFKRFASKLDRGDSFVESFIRDRNLYALVNKPVYILFGSGEAKMSRFAHNNNELHSTWLGFLFYYGIIPFSILIAWIRQNMKRIDWYVLPVYICVFAEAFTLVNHRQPSFWTLIALASVTKRKTSPPRLDQQNTI